MTTSKEQVELCSCCYENHGEKVPLIWTFAFRGAEYWCPTCGANLDMFGSGLRVERTSILTRKEKKYKELSKKYLNARSHINCDSCLYKGEWIKFEQLPLRSQNYYRRTAKDYKYKYNHL